MKGEERFTPTLFFLTGGFAIWAAHFFVIYSYAGLLCARPEWARLQLLNVGVVPLGVAAATIAALLALALLAGSAKPHAHRRHDGRAALLAGAFGRRSRSCRDRDHLGRDLLNPRCPGLHLIQAGINQR